MQSRQSDGVEPVHSVPEPPNPMAPLIDGDRALRAIRDRWWLLILVPVVALIVSLLWMRFEPYQTTVQATVLLPGDTEDPGNSERPELMILDDLPSLVRSRVFAEGVHARMQTTTASVEQVQDSLDGSRYSRILTVTISDDSRETVTAIAESVALQLPELINAYLVPDEGQAATVRIINPPTEPERSRDNDRLQLLLVGISALVVGALIATVAGPRGQSIQA